MEVNEGWIVRNLRLYGNSVVPNELIDKYGTAGVEKMIEMVLKRNVIVKKSKDQVFACRICGNENREIIRDCYIALAERDRFEDYRTY